MALDFPGNTTLGSVAVRVWLPVCRSETVTVATPSTNFTPEGRMAVLSVLVSVRASLSLVAVLPSSSSAVTVRVNDDPATALVGMPEKTSCAAAPGGTEIPVSVPVSLPSRVAASSSCVPARLKVMYSTA